MTGGPDLILARGRIYTCDPERSWAEAVAIHKGKIIDVGGNWEIESIRGPGTRYVDLGGAFVLPGFSDTHTHFLDGSVHLAAIDLRDAASLDEFRERVRASVSRLQPGEWLCGGYWNQSRWGGRLPDKGWIDDLTPENPVMLYRQDIHTAVCNSLALEAAEITASTPEIEGGIIIRDDNGEPNGLLIECAMKPVKKAIPYPSLDLIKKGLGSSMHTVNSLGITHLCDVVAGPEDLATYLDLEREGFLTCRFDLLPQIETWEKFARAGLRSGVGLELVSLGHMKAFLDGSLGSRSALMFEPFDDDPGNKGLLNSIAEPLSSLRAIMECVDKAGLGIALHAIGDRANRIALDQFEHVRHGSPYPNLRHRIEHAQHLHPDDIGRFAQLRLIAACQPVHLVDDSCYAEKAIGPERCRYAYAFRSLIDAGATLIFGSDWPVADINPLAGIRAAVTRQSSDGKHPGGWVPEEKISLEEAIAGYTTNAAYAGGHEGQWGAIKPGLSADLTVLDRDLFKCDPDEIPHAKVLHTFLEGRQVYPEKAE